MIFFRKEDCHLLIDSFFKNDCKEFIKLEMSLNENLEKNLTDDSEREYIIESIESLKKRLRNSFMDLYWDINSLLTSLPYLEHTQIQPLFCDTNFDFFV